MRRWGLLLLALGTLGAADAWDWLPAVLRDGDALWLSLRPADGVAGWSARSGGTALALSASGGALTLNVPTREVGDGVVFAGGGRRHQVRLLAPGQAAGLRGDDDGRLRLGDDYAVLRCPAVDDQQDRRWLLLRRVTAVTPAPQPCTRRLRLPSLPFPRAQAALPALAVAAQALAVAEQRILVEVPADLRAAWPRRDRRLALGWIVADLLARGASVVVLVLPTAPQAEAELLAPLLAETRAVAALWHCPVVEMSGLAAERWWELAPGTLGPDLNAIGQAEHQRLLAPWLAP